MLLKPRARYAVHHRNAPLSFHVRHGWGSNSLQRRNAPSSPSTKRGQTMKEIAARHGIHRVTVSEILNRTGTAKRPQGMNTTQAKRAARLSESGLSLANIGAQLGFNATTIRAVLLRPGVTTRDSNGRPQYKDCDSRTRGPHRPAAVRTVESTSPVDRNHFSIEYPSSILRVLSRSRGRSTCRYKECLTPRQEL